MTIKEIVERAIPITVKDCTLEKGRKERLREETIKRINEYLERELQSRNNARVIGDL